MSTPETDLLRRLYVDEQLTIGEVAATLGVAAQTVHNRLVAAQIARRASPSTPRTDISDDEIRRLYIDRCWSAAEIAAHFGCGASTVYTRLDGMRLARRPARPRQDGRPGDDQMRRLYRTEGLSLRHIATRYQVSAQTVHGWVAAAGIDRRPPGALTPTLDSGELAEQYHAGRSGLELARQHRCSPTTIYRRLQDAGVDRRQPTPALDRETLIAALAQRRSAPEIAAQLDASITAVRRALRREHLQTPTQAARQRSADHLTALRAELEPWSLTDGGHNHRQPNPGQTRVRPRLTSRARSPLRRCGRARSGCVLCPRWRTLRFGPQAGRPRFRNFDNYRLRLFLHCGVEWHTLNRSHQSEAANHAWSRRAVDRRPRPPCIPRDVSTPIPVRCPAQEDDSRRTR
jgi:predicted DNA-binding protein YlxM (UPF0122 family)